MILGAVPCRDFVFAGSISTPPRSFAPLCLFTVCPALAESPYEGHWQGHILLPTGELKIDLDFTSDAEGTLEGDISIPVQKLNDVDLTEVEIHEDGLRFAIPNIPGNPRFDGALSNDGETLSGTFRQGAAELEFTMKRGDDPVPAAQAALEGFDAVVDQAIEDFNVPGLVLAVVTGDQVAYADGFGYRDLENKLPMDADTLFAIGSTTKAMTSTVLAMQVEEGLLDWDEPVIRRLPGFDLEDSALAGRVTARDLVTHRVGMPRHDWVWYGNTTLKRAQLIERLPHLPLTTDLRQSFQYNNLMYATAGYLSGRLEFTTWEAVMRRRLFQPLGMARSNFSVETSQQDANHALPYRENEDDELERIPFRHIDLIGPAGSVNSSVREMANWLRLNLSDGTFDGKPLLKESTLVELHTPQMTVGSPPPFDRTQISQIAYGMGWNIETYRGLRRIRHNGGIDGFITTVMFFPDHDLGVVAATNRGSGLSMLVAQLAADRVLGLKPIDWTGEALARQERTRGRQRGRGDGRSHPNRRDQAVTPPRRLRRQLSPPRLRRSPGRFSERRLDLDLQRHRPPPWTIGTTTSGTVPKRPRIPTSKTARCSSAATSTGTSPRWW